MAGNIILSILDGTIQMIFVGNHSTYAERKTYYQRKAIQIVFVFCRVRINSH